MIRRAIIDLGTNTFHLMIVDYDEQGSWTETYRERFYVKLAVDGINVLSPAAIERADKALEKISAIVDEHQVRQIRAVGTAALRTADNALTFLDQILRKYSINVKIINGDQEAHLIYVGVSSVWESPQKPALIMDIGGGSVEFVLADATQYIWRASFPIGVAILRRKYHKAEPITASEIDRLTRDLMKILESLQTMIKKYNPKTLIGASGTFDVIAYILDGESEKHYISLPIGEVDQLIDEITCMDHDTRTQDDRIPNSRADMIVVALLLIKTVKSMGSFDHLGISTYALKEGIATVPNF